jgi:hypothetical protein
LAEDAEGLGTRRYAVLARLLEARAWRAAGISADLDAIGALVLAVDDVAGLESWWLTAEIADAFDVDAWRSLAGQRVAHLASQAGPLADELRRYAATLLESSSTTGR